MKILKISCLALVAISTGACGFSFGSSTEYVSSIEFNPENVLVAEADEFFSPIAEMYVAQAPDLVQSTISFPLNKKSISKEAANTLEAHVSYLKSNPNAVVTIAGYACPLGPTDFNQQISEKRAKAVEQHLIANGIAADRIEVKAMGENYDSSLEYAALEKSEQIKALAPQRCVILTYEH